MGYAHGHRWTEDEIAQSILEVTYSLNIDRMPSASEVSAVLGDTSLNNAIRRNGGFYKWANKMGLEVKECETTTGKGYEVIAKNLIENLNYKVEKMSTKYPFDLLVNDKIRIDVKVCSPYISRGSRVHTVGINKKYATCDLYLIFALDEDKNIERTFIIPGCDLRVTSMNFGKDSIYNIYLDRWDLLKKYNDFYNNLASMAKS